MLESSITPAFQNKGCVIVLSSSDFYAPYLCACVKSIIHASCSSNYYDILVLEKDMTESSKSKILYLAKKEHNISIRFINISQSTKGISFFVNGVRISQETYFGLLVSWLLPEYVKLIIMDSDMIVKKDIAELYHEDIDGYFAGVTIDVVLQGWLREKNNDFFAYYEETLNLKDPFLCFNGGLLLLNLVKIREAYNIDTIKHYLNEYQFRVVDQDIHNILFHGKVKYISIKWNHLICANDAFKKAIESAPKDIQDSYAESAKSPYIIHYAGDEKPWINIDVEYAEDFWEMARLTPFYELLMIRLVDSRFKKLCESISSVNPHVNIDNDSGVPVIDTRPSILKFADKWLPFGTRKRRVARFIVPRGSFRWRLLKKIYFIFKPQYRVTNLMTPEELSGKSSE